MNPFRPALLCLLLGVLGHGALSACVQDPTAAQSPGARASGGGPLSNTILDENRELTFEEPPEDTDKRLTVEIVNREMVLHVVDPDKTYSVVTYIISRDNDEAHYLLHIASDVPASDFEIRASVLRFYQGDYTISAYIDATGNAIAKRKFNVRSGGIEPSPFVAGASPAPSTSP